MSCIRLDTSLTQVSLKFCERARSTSFFCANVMMASRTLVPTLSSQYDKPVLWSPSPALALALAAFEHPKSLRPAISHVGDMELKSPGATGVLLFVTPSRSSRPASRPLGRRRRDVGDKSPEYVILKRPNMTGSLSPSDANAVRAAKPRSRMVDDLHAAQTSTGPRVRHPAFSSSHHPP